MSRKTEVAYDAVLDRAYAILNAGNRVNIIMTDFEVALRNSASRTFAEARIVGCNFHFERVSLKLNI